MSLIERFSGNVYGGITFAGNSLMVSQRKDARPLSELSDSCSFITQDLAKKFKEFPEGTTENYELNSSAAPLMLPRDAYVVYSELVWGGIYKTTGGGIPEELLDSKIKFILPESGEEAIEPAFETSSTHRFTNADVYSYTRSAIVTELVRDSGPGFYSVGAVPSYFAPGDNLSQIFASAGWTLAVIYRRRDTKVPLKNINFFVGAIPVNEKENKTVTFGGFSTPKETEPQASVLLSACCGDISPEENSVAFSHDETEDFVPICGPNNLRTHFFASQINNANGFLETNGTFGKYNHFLVGSDYVGSDCGRQGWDITEIDISHLIKHEKASGILKFSSQDDRFCVNAAALCIDTDGEETEFTDDNYVFASQAGELNSIKTLDAAAPAPTPLMVAETSPAAPLETSNVEAIPTLSETSPMLSEISPTEGETTDNQNNEKIVEETIIMNKNFLKNNLILNAKASPSPVLKTSPLAQTTNALGTTPATPPITPTQNELFSQALVERLYTYNIEEISNYSIRYDSARVVNFGAIPVLTASYTLTLTYKDCGGKAQTSVKRGSVSFMDISMSMVNSCTIRILPSSAFIDGNEVIFRACVKVFSVS